ncbi:MAG: hypothetical protein FWG63_08730 [Defluviitaleaceae bacterium]|nr:hypothetical protein [Defluviitaleaceae bacterium]
MFMTMLGLATAAFSWFFAIACLKGCNWVLVTGYSIADKETKQKYREKNDVPAMNKYIGKTIFLPLAIVMTFFTVISLIDLPPDLFSLVGNVLGVGGVVATVLAVKGAITVVFSGRFERKVEN